MAEEHTQRAKGRVKEAAGAIADDNRLREEGRGEQADGSVDSAKEKLGDAADALKGAAADVADAIRKRL